MVECTYAMMAIGQALATALAFRNEQCNYTITNRQFRKSRGRHTLVACRQFQPLQDRSNPAQDDANSESSHNYELQACN